MFIEINPADAAERGIKNRDWVHVWGPEMPSGKRCRMKARVTERITKGVAWCPFHFAGLFMSADQRSKYPRGTDPIVIGESVNAITTYGYDPATGMQEPKATLCQIMAA
jgi:formate dehydrogenase major subunit